MPFDLSCHGLVHLLPLIPPPSPLALKDEEAVMPEGRMRRPSHLGQNDVAATAKITTGIRSATMR
jgi:hypothetical protein